PQRQLVRSRNNHQDEGHGSLSWRLQDRLYFPFGRINFLGCCRDTTYLVFQLGACTKDHDSAWREDEFFACMGISSSSSNFVAYYKHPKFGDADWFTLLKGGFEQLENPVQDPGRLLFWDPGLLM